MHNLGHTRSTLRPDHLLQTPDTFVRTALPGMNNASAIIHVAPAAGAGFLQYTAELDAGGSLGPAPAGIARFAYVLSGQVDSTTGPVADHLGPGGFTYSPAGQSSRLGASAPARIAVIERHYRQDPYAANPQAFTGRESEIAPTHLGGDEALEVRTLIPDTPAHDFAVNTMQYQPGASLAQVEIHVMEHGLLMLEGGGIYRLGDQWYPVTAGDFIWMAPYCPQWFACVGKTPAKYLIYKDWNRHPLTREARN